MGKLEENEIETRPFFYPMHVMPPYKKEEAECFPIAEELRQKGLNLPTGINLAKGDINLIVQGIKNG